jgi:hypothetical protein
LGFLFLKVNLGIFLGFFEKGKFEILKFIWNLGIDFLVNLKGVNLYDFLANFGLF